MPTTPRRRRRKAAYSPVVQALLDGRTVKRAPENHHELEQIMRHWIRDYRELPFLVSFARTELEQWERDVH